jgi:periplasmic copper chaperone A
MAYAAGLRNGRKRLDAGVMKTVRNLTPGAAAAALVLIAAPALAHMPGGLEAAQAWSRPAAAGGTAAGYLTIRNHGKAEQVLVRVETPAAKRAEIHRSVSAGGVARMEPVARLAIPAGGEARLAPGGTHLMLVGLKTATRTGQRLPATLVFASGVRIKADMTVGQAPPPAKAGSIHNH